MTGSETASDGCANVCLNAYRLMIADAVPFGRHVEFDIEHGWDSDLPANYSSVAYWYGRPTNGLTQTDVVELSDGQSRVEHGYRVARETSAGLTSTYEGKRDNTRVPGRVSSATGTISFTAKLAADNRGFRMYRTSDQATAFQRAKVFVNGRYVGLWHQPLGNRHSRWLEDAFDVPAGVVAGRQEVTVRLEPVTGAPAWSAARYRVVSRVGD